ncbi:antigen WC1.1-like [Alligator sinensis]|uniref:Antigen WC1.1-like n=1 Tax=Alligator sinensis TaxID=38654 RepID=A0A3Q0HNI2_ALLSI|nr:antigen WC1.1-like [Alligator sinensis]
MTSSPKGTDPPPTHSGGDMVPIVICIFLGVLLCLVLVILAGQVQNARAQQRGSITFMKPFSEALYEEINYSPVKEKQEFSVHSEASVLPRDAPSDGYDDAGEISDPKHSSAFHQNDEKVSESSEKSDGTRNSQTDDLYSLESEGTTRTDRKDPSLCSGDIECDDVEDGVGGTLI